MMNRQRVLSLLLSLLLILSLGGCAAPQGIAPAAGREETHLRLRNGTGWDIIALSLCEISANTGYKKNLLVRDYVLRNGTWIDIYYPHAAPTATETAGDAATAVLADRGEQEPVLQPEYRMLAVLSDGQYFELSKFPLDDMSEGTLLLEEGVGYLSYQSLSTRQQVSTKGAEHATISMFGKAEVDLSALLPGSTSGSKAGEEADPNAVPTPTPKPSMRPIDAPDEDEDGLDPNEGCLTDGLFY